ncbi:MAG: Ig-like domain-containing protein [Gemmatimonadaceae bacterium]
MTRGGVAPWRILTRTLGVFGALGLLACANQGVPPGGPPDLVKPRVLGITPKNGAIGIKPKEVEIRFDEVISEVPKGAPDLTALVFISPRVKETIVDWHRTRITIRAKGGWKPNTVYNVQVAPGISDLRNNTLDSALAVVFTTGGAVPLTSITGVAFDWVAGRVASKALIQAIAPGKDSTTYQVLADSTGRFNLQYLPPGDYLLRALIDRNNNQLLDRSEAFDTLRTKLDRQATAEFYVFPHDTVGLRISEVVLNPTDSLKVLKVVYDKPLAPGQQLQRTAFLLKATDSSVVNVVLAQTAAEKAVMDSLRKKAADDSAALKAKAKADTSAAARAKADTLARKARADSVAAAEKAARDLRAKRLAAQRGGRPEPPKDTTPLPKMNRPTVAPEVYLTLEKPLEPGKSYRLQSAPVRSLSGTVRTPARQFTTPRVEKKDTVSKAAPKGAADKAAAAKDTVGKRPPGDR